MKVGLKLHQCRATEYRFVGDVLFSMAISVSAFAMAEGEKSIPSLSNSKSIVSTASSMPSAFSSRSILSAGSKQSSVIRYDMEDFSYITSPTSADNLAALPNACKKDSTSICYDYRSGRMVIVKTRDLLPEITGLKAEGISLKRDKVAVRYSF